MKLRTWFIPLLILLIAWPFAGTVRTEAASASVIQIYLNGDLLPSDTAPYLKPKENVTMVPLRVISEGLGASVLWSQATKTATIQKNGNKLVLITGQGVAEVNGSSVTLDVSVENIRGRTMVPIRFVSEQLGLDVVWNQSLKTISLTSKDGDPQLPGEEGQNPQPPVNPPQVSNELRGAWVSTVYNLDWPSSTSAGKAESQKQDYVKLLDDLQGMGINAVFVQVRPSGDAFYSSDLVPWSTYLTGVSGKDPGYDPLQFMIDETHRRGMEFHAWFNPFRASTDTNTAKLANNHVANSHPEWIVNFANKLYINPGIPDAREHVIDTIMEVVNRYDIDGVHLDDYFYPTGETKTSYFNDDSTYKQYNSKQMNNKGDWRRDNINEFVKDLGRSIHQVKPNVSFGISPFGVWRNKSTDPTGSDTKAGITAYDSTYADVRAWIQNDWVDYVTPQIYWSMSFNVAKYDTLVDWWAKEVAGSRVKLYIGHAPYKLGTSEAGWNSAQEIINQLTYNRSVPEVSGSIFFSAKELRKNPLGLIPLLQSFYSL
ncbi:family 10 glycosylhydrolase [Paenibacillus motobuensis]|uniref:family 10 glycosylhydrolase n=1 Tax=Paenibacillus TaxID=44249 RepID=UPI00203C7A47|nr:MULTISPECIES: family 10 glycosylhydrolase [Paenibacillus]MCM3040265.1 family 10 glycosylhydrolase [Paenibacillus lutimineralis]MCM3647369.1 family 10 glycosylhydrolase [Paenibacillus motobuensis]